MPFYRCNLAGGGHADVPAVHIARLAADDGDHRFAVHADPWLEHHGTERLQRLHLHHHLDHRVPYDKSAGAEIQARISRVVPRQSGLISVYSALRTLPRMESADRRMLSQNQGKGDKSGRVRENMSQSAEQDRRRDNWRRSSCCQLGPGQFFRRGLLHPPVS